MTAVALAAAVGLLLAEGFLPHTDDGCEVEVHCLACRLLLTTAAPRLVAAPVVVPRVAVSFRPAPDGLRLPTAPSARPAASRAPPLA